MSRQEPELEASFEAPPEPLYAMFPGAHGNDWIGYLGRWRTMLKSTMNAAADAIEATEFMCSGYPDCDCDRDWKCMDKAALERSREMRDANNRSPSPSAGEAQRGSGTWRR